MNNRDAHAGPMAIFTISLLLLGLPGAAQAPDSVVQEQIAITARPTKDSITLRWAPLTFNAWQAGNNTGYKVERYTLSRNGILLDQPEKIILRHSIQPLPEHAWEDLVRENKYAAIEAQALFGDVFEVDLKQSDIFSIVNKVHENEQRYAFALFCADMVPTVAKAAGLWFTDYEVNEGEKYLYRVLINTQESVRGSIYIGTEDLYELPRPQNLKADFEENLVSLRWDKNAATHYTAYILERSENGRDYKRISDTPLVTVSPGDQEDGRHEYAMDTLKHHSITYYYRVKGLTPFGDESLPSNAVSGSVAPVVERVPYITSAENIQNSFIRVEWDFPASSNVAIRGFDLQRSPNPQGLFSSIASELIPPEVRLYQDLSPMQVNYYRIIAQGLDGEFYPSHIFFAQLIDSIPPARPADLKANAMDDGKIHLSWRPNDESDIYGYRVYKAYHQSEELAQVTSAPITRASFSDTIDLNTLNESVYYSVMAIDNNQNHSPLSALLKVTLPDKTRPQPPVLLPLESDREGILLSWVPGGSEDITGYRIYRKSQASQSWELVRTMPAGSDSIYYHKDKGGPDIAYYTIVSVDDAGLESPPAHPVTGSRVQTLRPAITWRRPRINREDNQLTISWNHSQSNIQTFRLYRAVDTSPPVLFKIVQGDEAEFTDDIIPGRTYTYRIMAHFADGAKSLFSEAIKFEY